MGTWEARARGELRRRDVALAALRVEPDCCLVAVLVEVGDARITALDRTNGQDPPGCPRSPHSPTAPCRKTANPPITLLRLISTPGVDEMVVDGGLADR